MTSQQGSSSSVRKRKITWIVTALAIVLLIGSYVYYTQSSAAPTIQESQTQTEIVRRGDLTVSASGSGLLIAQTDASFNFDTSGQVVDVYVKVGDLVEAGQVLAQLADTLARVEYEEAQRAVQELYSAASIATIKQEIAAAQDAEAAAKE